MKNFIYYREWRKKYTSILGIKKADKLFITPPINNLKIQAA